MRGGNVDDVETLDKIAKDLNNLAEKYGVQDSPAAEHLHTAVTQIRQAIERLSESYSPPSPNP
jgi:hypothetical protein